MPQIEIQLPISKSFANRALVLAFLSEQFDQFLQANHLDLQNGNRDTNLLIKALMGYKKGTSSFDFVDAGTPSRLFTALAAAVKQPTENPVTITGNTSLKNRSIKPLVDALISCGAKIEYLSVDGYFPIQINKKITHFHSVEINRTESSQFITAMMLIAPLFEGQKTIHLVGEAHSQPYVNLSANQLIEFGIALTFIGSTQTNKSQQSSNDKQQILIDGTYEEALKISPISSSSKTIPRDWSSAAFFYPLMMGNMKALPDFSVANKPVKYNAVDELEFCFPGLSLMDVQGDKEIANIATSLGIQTIAYSTNQNDSIENSDYSGVRIKIKNHTKLSGWTIQSHKTGSTLLMDGYPDLVPAVIAMHLIAGKSILMTGLNNLQYKESDRIHALQTNLAPLGVTLKNIGHDLWKLDCEKLKWPKKFHIQTFSDHRIAMAFSCLTANIHAISIDDSECVEKSFPLFWQQYKKCKFEK